MCQKELGDVVYVELPEKGATVTKGEAFGVVESVKVSQVANSASYSHRESGIRNFVGFECPCETETSGTRPKIATYHLQLSQFVALFQL